VLCWRISPVNCDDSFSGECSALRASGKLGESNRSAITRLQGTSVSNALPGNHGCNQFVCMLMIRVHHDEDVITMLQGQRIACYPVAAVASVF